MHNTGQLPLNEIFHDHYIILEVVGQGGMGCVYKAIDTAKGNCVVAIKEMKQGNLAPRDLYKAQRRFKQEAEMLQKLTPHAHLPTFYEAFSEGNHSYFVMDFVEGKTLQQLLRESSTHQLPLKTVLDYAIQLCEVLLYLHGQSPPIIFRDLKPSNVIVTDRGEVYLIDFGIARHFKPDQLMDTESFGSLGYCAPEIYKKVQTEPRSDLYSLGATVHHCLTGRSPNFNSPTFFDFPAIRSFNVQVPTLLENLIMRLVATVPEKRPNSAEKVLQALQEMQQWFASPTMKLSDPDMNTVGLYYDPAVAHAVQFQIRWSRLNKLPGQIGRLWLKTLPFFAVLGAWFLYTYLPFCQWLGLKFITAIRVAPTRWRSINATLKGQFTIFQRGVPARISLRQRFAMLADALWASPLLAPLVGLLLVTAGGSICMLTLFHCSLSFVLFVLSVLLLVFTVVSSLKEEMDHLARSILAIITLAMLFLCIVLLPQTDVQASIQGIQVNQLLAVGSILLGVAVLFHHTNHVSRLSHLAVSAGAGVCALLQYILGPLEVQVLTLPYGATTNMVSVVLLSIIALISFLLFLFGRPFSLLERIWAVIPMFFCLWLQSIFGVQDLQFLQPFLPMQVATLNFVLMGVAIIITLMCFYFPDQALWLRIKCIPLFMLDIIVGLLLLTLRSLTDLESSMLFLNVLMIKPFEYTYIDHLVIAILLLVMVILSRSLLKLYGFFIQALALNFLAIVCIFLFLSHWHSTLAFYMLALKPIILLFMEVAVVVEFCLLAAFPVVHLISQRVTDSRLVTSITLVIVLLGQVMLAVCAVTCLLFQIALGQFFDFSVFESDGLTITFNQILLLLIGTVALFAVLRAALILHQRLRSIAHMSKSKLSWVAQEDVELPSFTRSDLLIMFATAFYMIVLWNVQVRGSLSTIPVLLWISQLREPFPLWLVIFGLLIVAIASCYWFQFSFSLMEQRVLWAIFLLVFISMLFTIIGMFVTFIKPFILIGVIGVFILLIQGECLAMWTRETQ